MLLRLDFQSVLFHAYNYTWKNVPHCLPHSFLSTLLLIKTVSTFLKDQVKQDRISVLFLNIRSIHIEIEWEILCNIDILIFGLEGNVLTDVSRVFTIIFDVQLCLTGYNFIPWYLDQQEIQRRMKLCYIPRDFCIVLFRISTNTNKYKLYIVEIFHSLIFWTTTVRSALLSFI